MLVHVAFKMLFSRAERFLLRNHQIFVLNSSSSSSSTSCSSDSDKQEEHEVKVEVKTNPYYNALLAGAAKRVKEKAEEMQAD